jgi:hypothetical protein
VRENGEGRKEERFSEHSSRLSGNPENLFSSARYPSLFPKTLRQTSDLFFATILSGTIGAAIKYHREEVNNQTKVMDSQIVKCSDHQKVGARLLWIF